MAEQQEKPLHELLSRDMVDLYVGQENTQWTLHEKLLCHRSKFFRNIFYGKDNKNHSFGLPDEEDEPFRMFVGWLYSAYVPAPREEKDLTNLFELYLMGEKWAIKGLVLEVLKSVRTYYADTDSYPALRRVQYIYANTDVESPMRQLLISSVARNLVTSEGMPPQWDKALRKNGQLAVDIIIAVQKWGLEKDSVPDSRQEPVKPILEESEQAKQENSDKSDENDAPQVNGVHDDDADEEQGDEEQEDGEEGQEDENEEGEGEGEGEGQGQEQAGEEQE